MNIRDHLAGIANRIRAAYPILPDYNHSNHSQVAEQRALISDIQKRLAEMYGLIQREIEDNGLSLDYQQAQQTCPERVNSIFNTLHVLALATRTKLNINDSVGAFSTKDFQTLDQVCFDCYILKVTSQNEEIPENCNKIYEKGLAASHTYTDYQTGFGKQLRPGLVAGQIMLLNFGSTAQTAIYTKMINDAQQTLSGVTSQNHPEMINIYSTSPEFSQEVDTMFKGVFSKTPAKPKAQNAPHPKKPSAKVAELKTEPKNDAEFFIESAEKYLDYKYTETKLSIIFHYIYFAKENDKDNALSDRISDAQKRLNGIIGRIPKELQKSHPDYEMFRAFQEVKTPIIPKEYCPNPVVDYSEKTEADREAITSQATQFIMKINGMIYPEGESDYQALIDMTYIAFEYLLYKKKIHKDNYPSYEMYLQKPFGPYSKAYRSEPPALNPDTSSSSPGFSPNPF